MTYLSLIPRFFGLVVVCSFANCDQAPQQKDPTQSRQPNDTALEQSRTQSLQIVDELRESYNADDTWQGSFKRVPIWTQDVKARLIRSDGRPILGIGSLHDVDELDGRSVLHFSGGLMEKLTLHHTDIRFILKCGHPEDRRKDAANLGEQISASAMQEFVSGDKYVFVAQIHEVVRRDKLVASVANEESAEIEVDSNPLFVAMGECLAVKYIGMYRDDLNNNSMRRLPGETPDEYLKRRNRRG